MTERRPEGMSVESWVDAQIARGMARGDFDDLPGAGKPLPRRDPEETAYEWVLEKARTEDLDLTGMLPPGMRLRRERDLLPAVAAGLTSEAAVRALAADYDHRVEQFWRRPQLTPDAVPGLADVAALVAHWRATRPPEPEAAEAPPPTPLRRRWWQFRTPRLTGPDHDVRASPGRTRPDS